ncbi:hypothetical protein [Spongiimicrobium sp. 2-473A-2-J]|uniref:hypothetical protein n=1 Tax=Eudoraea algarum TaxID=3417568 RepID=UPI003D35E456
MKKVILAVMVMAGLTAMAQKGEGKGHHGFMKDMTPEQLATLQTKKMTLALELSAKQQQQIQRINLENAELRKAKMEELRTKKESGKREKPTADERFTMLNERLDKKIAAQSELKRILNEEQFEQWKKMQLAKDKHQMHRAREKHGRK